MSAAAMANPDWKLSEVEEQAKKLLKTAPFDSRFPNQNQTRYCNQNYIDYHRCRKLKGEDYEPCEYFKKLYKSMCLNSWINKWDDQIENGTFPVKI